MRTTFRDANYEALARLWNEFHRPEFAIDADLLRLNTEACPVMDWGASFIEWGIDDKPEAMLVIKRSANPRLYSGQDKDLAHLSAIAFREPGQGLDLMAEAKAVLRDRGVREIVFGQDSSHFFPGCPCTHQRLLDFLMIEGFSDGVEVFDLERDLSDYQPPADGAGEVEGRPLGSEDVGKLQSLLKEEFSDRWRHDTMAKVEEEGPGTVIGLFHGDRLYGFALTQDFRHRRPIGGAIWRHSLGDAWGSVGPIGIAHVYRGKGWGSKLLAEALLDLKRRQVARCIIDWTVLEDFYAKHGFSITRRYKSMSLSLENRP